MQLNKRYSDCWNLLFSRDCILANDNVVLLAYSYFEKRCRKKSTKLHKPISKGSMGRRIELLHVLNTNEI